MKNSARNTVANLINTRLAALGAANIPTSARQVIEDNIWVAVAALITRRISGPVVGRAVARALAAPAATNQGLKGGTPLTSSEGRNQGAEPNVAGRTPSSATVESAAATDRPDQVLTGDRL